MSICMALAAGRGDVGQRSARRPEKIGASSGKEQPPELTGHPLLR
jgi:hypothetical protein